MGATVGISFLQVLLNGEKIAAFDWDSDHGSALASRPSETEFTLEGLALSGDDVIELAGQGEGGAPLRVDYPELTPMSLPGATDIWFEAVNPDGVGNRVMIGRNAGTGRCAVADPGVRSGGRGGEPETCGARMGATIPPAPSRRSDVLVRVSLARFAQ